MRAKEAAVIWARPQIYRALGSPAFRAEHVNLGIKHRS